MSSCDSKPKKYKRESIDRINETNHISSVEQIPDHIKNIENITIYLGDTNPTHTIELIQEQIFGNDEDTNFYLIYKCVEDDLGRLIVWGNDSSRGLGVYVYNEDGTYHSQLGKQGKGPGEYLMILNIFANNNRIYITDYSGLRLNEYSTNNYSFLRSIKFDSWNKDDKHIFKNTLEPRNDGNYLLWYTDPNKNKGQLEIILKVKDSYGNDINDNTIIFPAGFAIDSDSKSDQRELFLPLLFMRNTVTALSNGDELYAASTNEFLIKKFDSNGVFNSAFYYPIIGKPFDLDVYTKTSAFTPKPNQISKALKKIGEELPKTFPIIENIIVDDENRIWVAIPMDEEKEYYEWWILKESGQLIAKKILSHNQRIFEIKNGYLYTRKENGKKRGYLYSGDGSDPVDSEYIVKYKIKLSKLY